MAGMTFGLMVMLGLSLITISMGVWGLLRTGQRAEISRVIAEMPRRNVAEVEPGLARIRGRVADGTELRAWRRARFRETSGAPGAGTGGAGWKLDDQAIEPDTFAVEDETGRITVDLRHGEPEESSLDLSSTKRRIVADDGVLAILHDGFTGIANPGGTLPPSMTSSDLEPGDERTQEAELRPGDEVSVFGTVADGDDRTLVRPTGDESPIPLVIADRNLDETRVTDNVDPFNNISTYKNIFLIGMGLLFALIPVVILF